MARPVASARRAWRGTAPPPDPSALPPGLERSYEPVQAGTRYARFAKAVHKLASAIDPDVKVTYYAYLNLLLGTRSATANASKRRDRVRAVVPLGGLVSAH